jgi:hypothetical protein
VLIPLSISQQLSRREVLYKGYGYNDVGYYFVTLCAHERVCSFGEIIDGKMVLNAAGVLLDTIWMQIPEFYY